MRFKLVKIVDMRTFDYLRGEYLPLESGCGNICDRCTREHARVYVVFDREEDRERHVGSTCCKKLLNWEPSKEDVKTLEKVIKDGQKREKKRAMLEFVGESIKEIAKNATRIDQQQSGIYTKQIKALIAEKACLVWEPGTTKFETLCEKLLRQFYGAGVPLRIRDTGI